MADKNKEIKLRRVNSKKYCLTCGGIMEIKMDGLVGKCIECGEVLYTLICSRK